MLFYMTTLYLTRFLTEDAPKVKEDENAIQVISVEDGKHFDFLCRNYVMNDKTRPGYPSRVSRVVPPSGVPLYNP